MFQGLSFNSKIWMGLGALFILGGVYFGWEFRQVILRQFYLPFGLIFSGIGMIIAGFTNGFTDHSPFGQTLTKVGVLFFAGGLPVLIYGVWRSV